MDIPADSNVEMTWHVFGGEYQEIYFALLKERYELITARGLYEFKAQNPKSILRSQLRRHTVNVSGSKQASKASSNMSADGQFTLV